MSVSRVYAVAVASLMALCLITPLLIFLVKPAKEVSMVEKRKLSSFPAVTWEYESLQSFPEKFADYYQDHFGLRDFFVSFYNSNMLNIFNTSPFDYIIKGIDGWYFFVAGGVKDYYGLENIYTHREEYYSQTVIDRRDWLESLGIRYLFVPVPNKFSIYKDKLPARIRHLVGPSFYDRLIDYLSSEIGEMNVVDVRDVLNNKKIDHQVYFRTDTHWTHDGSLDTFNQIISQLNRWFPRLEKISKKDTLRLVKTRSGDLAYMLHQSNIISEKSVEISIKSPCANSEYSILPKHEYENIKKLDPVNKPLPEENGCNGKELTVLVIHDSFGSFMRPYFNESFSRVVYSGQYHFNDLQDFIISLQPDIVIEQRVARSLYKSLTHDIDLEKKVVQTQFLKQKSTVFDTTVGQESELFLDWYNVSISKQEDGYLLQSTSTDPQVFMSFEPNNLAGRYNAKLILTAPEETVVQLFYKPRGVSDFSEQYSVRRNIRKGYNELYFHIPGADNDGEIRLDPGNAAGEYVLHSLIVKERHNPNPNSLTSQ